VIFTRSFNPHDIIRLIKSRRFRARLRAEDPRRAARARDACDAGDAGGAAAGISIPGRWWRYRRVHSAFGMKFWAFVVGAAPLPPDLEESGAGWIRCDSRLRPDENGTHRHAEHPFKTSKGSVGTPIAGVDVRIAEDGEIHVRGENGRAGITKIPTPNSNSATPDLRSPVPGPGPSSQGVFDNEGWVPHRRHRRIDEQGRLFIKGRKKED
jgi:long-chain acyl-CoA synthetase